MEETPTVTVKVDVCVRGAMSCALHHEASMIMMARAC
jgi:hypothetical protein